MSLSLPRIMKRTRSSAAMNEEAASPKRRKENAGYIVLGQHENESRQKDGGADDYQEDEMRKVNIKGKGKGLEFPNPRPETDELVWEPELIWTTLPKPMPMLNDHPLLKTLPVPPEHQVQQKTEPATFIYLPPVHPNIPHPTLYMEPLSPILRDGPKDQFTKESDAKERELTTPTSSPAASSQSCPSSASAARGESFNCCKSPDSTEEASEAVPEIAEGKPTEGENPETSRQQRPHCTLHYYRRVQNAQEEGFHVIQGQVWHGRAMNGEGETDRGRRWRRHQWVITGPTPPVAASGSGPG